MTELNRFLLDFVQVPSDAILTDRDRLFILRRRARRYQKMQSLEGLAFPVQECRRMGDSLKPLSENHLVMHCFQVSPASIKELLKHNATRLPKE